MGSSISVSSESRDRAIHTTIHNSCRSIQTESVTASSQDGEEGSIHPIATTTTTTPDGRGRDGLPQLPELQSVQL